MVPEAGIEDVESPGPATTTRTAGWACRPTRSSAGCGLPRSRASEAARPVNAFWIVILILVFFAIHAGRLQTGWTWLGLISPLVATHR